LMVKRISDTNDRMKYVNLKMDEIIQGIDVIGRYNKLLRTDNIKLRDEIDQINDTMNKT